MKTRFDGAAATEAGILVGLRVESGVAVQFHTVRIPWGEVVGGDFDKYLAKYLRKRLRLQMEADANRDQLRLI